MNIIQTLLILIVSFEHLYICYIEMFAWEKSGNKILPEAEKSFLSSTKGMAANQGLYNAFLSAGLLWAIFLSPEVWAYPIAAFFLGCIVVAGTFGAIRSEKSIFFKQALPACIAILSIYLFH